MMIFIAVVLEPKLVQADDVWKKFKDDVMKKLPKGAFISNFVEQRKKGIIQAWLPDISPPKLPKRYGPY